MARNSKTASVQGGLGAEQRGWLYRQAERIERGEPIEDCKLVAACVRAFADRIPDAPKRARGQAPRIPRATLALDYAHLILSKGMTKTAARESLAQSHVVSIEALKRALKQCNADALLRTLVARREPNRTD